jgi:hypothetical protein
MPDRGHHAARPWLIVGRLVRPCVAGREPAGLSPAPFRGPGGEVIVEACGPAAVGIVQANVRLRLRSSLDRYRLDAVRASSAGVVGALDGLAVGRRRIGS